MVVRIRISKVFKTLKETTTDLSKLEAVTITEFTLAMQQYAGKILEAASSRAPSKTGALKGSAVVGDPEFEGKKISIRLGFNIVYAAIQNFGGEIFAKPGSALFIPLKAGVVPIKDKGAQKASGLIRNVDFALAQSVIINGNDYWTDGLEATVPQANKEIGKVAFQNIKAKMTA